MSISRYSGSMDLVHINEDYSLEEAMEKPDGLAIMAFNFKVDDGSKKTPFRVRHY